MNLALVLLAAAPAASNAVIWTGGTDADEVQAKLSVWPKDEARWSSRIKLQPGYPKLVKSDDVPGLKPGFHVILLGVCGQERVRARTRAIKELYPETYWRPLTAAQPEACPELYCASSNDMIAVPGGNAVFGCTAESGCASQPPKTVKELASFEIDRTEVTRGAYARCVASKECKALTVPAGDSLPAYASYVQAWQYCAAQGKRVVRDDEWEKAARGPDGRRYPWGARKPDCGMAQWYECGAAEAKPVASFPAWSSPYGVLDLYGEPSEWTDGAPLEADGKKYFPVRGDVQKEGGLWVQSHLPGDSLRAFRCARACTWREGAPLPVLQPPVDTEAKVDPAYANLVDLKLRAAFDAWRAERAAELGEGATVSFRETMVVGWQDFSNYVRETVGDACLEGPVRLKYEGGKVTKTRGGAIACCSKKCGPPTPAGAALRWVEAQRASDADLAKPFVPAKGFTHEERLNGKLEHRNKVTPDAPIIVSPDRDALSCDADWDANGAATCRSQEDSTSIEVKLKKTKTGAVVTGVVSDEIEGC